jgi:hypothetical protein
MLLLIDILFRGNTRLQPIHKPITNPRGALRYDRAHHVCITDPTMTMVILGLEMIKHLSRETMAGSMCRRSPCRSVRRHRRFLTRSKGDMRVRKVQGMTSSDQEPRLQAKTGRMQCNICTESVACMRLCALEAQFNGGAAGRVQRCPSSVSTLVWSFGATFVRDA